MSIIQLVSSGAVIAAATSDIHDIDDSEHAVRNVCDKCQYLSYEPMFHAVKAEDGGFPRESVEALKKLVDMRRDQGWKHGANMHGMVKQCAECSAKESSH